MEPMYNERGADSSQLDSRRTILAICDAAYARLRVESLLLASWPFPRHLASDWDLRRFMIELLRWATEVDERGRETLLRECREKITASDYQAVKRRLLAALDAASLGPVRNRPIVAILSQLESQMKACALSS
jgi:hypothetical protein